MKRLFAVLASFAVVGALAQTAPPTSPPQDPRAEYRERLCGSQGLPLTSTEIPSIGCFRVPAGSSAEGTIDGHHFALAVDAASGMLQCHLDGVITNCDACVGPDIPQCPVRLRLVTRNPDMSVSYSVQRNVGGNRYLSRIDAWNEYLAQKPKDNAAQNQPSPSPGPPLPPGLVLPGSAEPTDGPDALAAVRWKADGAYSAADFARLDALIDTLSQPDQLTDDGMPRLQGVYDGIWNHASVWRDWQGDLDKIAEWRKTFPDSYGADLVEAIMWRAWAWRTRGPGMADTVTPEGWKLFRSKIARADEILEASKQRASKSPLWYSLRLAIARDAGWDHERYRAVFDEATRRFPWYVPLYLSAGNYLSPKWGGSYEAVDALARRSTNIPLGADYSLYARVYWDVSAGEGLEFDLFKESLATWPRMKSGFEGLMKRYPNSKWNLNAYAYFACVADDAATYGALRVKIGRDVNPFAWASNHSPEVCDERLLGHT